MKKLFALLAISLFSLTISAQIRIDSSFPFQTDPDKKYSMYIPTGYNMNTPHRLMLALHPFNTNRWNAISWCDTLVNFAEINNLILICPDGGLDGKIDDPIDTAFTSVILDSMKVWYNIDSDKVYAMGFSWGGKTTYTYGLRHASMFGGFLPVGSAMSGTNEVAGVLQNGNGKPFYIVHGSGDSPSVRFTPIKDSLINRNAIVNFNLMSGVGHTIDFPNRNQILTTAFQWIDSVNCAIITGINNEQNQLIDLVSIHPSVVKSGQNIYVQFELQNNDRIQLEVVTVNGSKVKTENFIGIHGLNEFIINTGELDSGMYFFRFSFNNSSFVKKIIVN